ncbi:MAG: YfgM family protein [Desulfobaccales bacterium]
MARKKPLPRALQEPEEILSFAQQLLKYFRPYLKWLLSGSVILILILVGSSGYRYLQYIREAKAQAALDKVRPQLSQMDKADEALKALEAVIRDYPSTRSAWLARAFRGHLLYQGGKYAEAAKAYEELAAAAPSLRDYGWNPFIIESLSYCYEAEGNFTKAADTLKPLADQVGGNYQTIVLTRLALLYDKAGQREEARKIWQRLLSQSPDRGLAFIWKEKLAVTEPPATPGSGAGKP